MRCNTKTRRHFGYMPEERGFYAKMRVREHLIYLGRSCMASPPPRRNMGPTLGQLLLGKVVGIGLVGLLQLAIIGTVALILIERTHVVTIPAFGAGDTAGGPLRFVLGFSLRDPIGSLFPKYRVVTLYPFKAQSHRVRYEGADPQTTD